MKSHFIRFLHNFLSHSDVKSQFTSSLSHSVLGDASSPSLSPSGLTRWSRSNQVANFSNLDTPIKSECGSMNTNATTCQGRSMVEMLGVLAIIGVLSVGAIAGYSKAMMKYKLNQYAQAVNMLINNALQITDKLAHGSDRSTAFSTRIR